MKHTVHIALAVDSTGRWVASGEGTLGEQQVLASEDYDYMLEAMELEQGERRYWVRADVELPADPKPEIVVGDAVKDR